MELTALAGNARLKQHLAQRHSGRGLSHACILSGPAGSGRHTLARELAMAMLCTAPLEQRPCRGCTACKKAVQGIHPDLSLITPLEEGKSITVDQIRALRADAHIRPNEAQRKIYVLEGADRINPSGQNAMLKLLEEGPAYAVFLLLAENELGLLETVRSRCESLELQPVTPAEAEEYLAGRFPGEDPQRLRQAARDCRGVLGRAVEMLQAGGHTLQELEQQAEGLCRCMVQGREEDLFELAFGLEKLPKPQLGTLLELLEQQLARAMADAELRRRANRGVELVRQLRRAQKLNVNPGQLAGWLCAGMFDTP
ncbi:MAG: AAA family ATPase [Oscillospiraceae bacterium]|nr:AAA family ATPase [Oscillospiraceae bacterium]